MCTRVNSGKAVRRRYQSFNGLKGRLMFYFLTREVFVAFFFG